MNWLAASYVSRVRYADFSEYIEHVQYKTFVTTCTFGFKLHEKGSKMAQAAKKKGIFYGYFVVAALFLIVFVCVTFGMTTMGTHYQGLAAQMGFEKVAISQWTVFVGIGTVISLPFTGQWIRKVDVRIPVTCADIVQAGMFICISFITNIVLFYACAFVVGIAMGILMNLMTAIVCSRWFTRTASTMIGIVFAASGVGGIVFNPMVAYLIKNYGAGFDYRVEAAIILVVALPSIWFLLRSRPEDKGLLALGADEAASNITAAPRAGVKASVAFKNPSFYCFAFVAFGSACLMYSYQMTTSYITTLPIYEELPLLAGTVMSFASAGQTLGKIFLGWVGDRNITLAYIVAMAAGILGLIGYLVFNTAAGHFYVTGFLVGITAAATNVLVPALCRSLYGTKDYESIWSVASMFNKTGGILQSIIFGGILTASGGNYAVMYTAFMVLMVLIVICTILSMVVSKKLRASWTTAEEDAAAAEKVAAKLAA